MFRRDDATSILFATESGMETGQASSSFPSAFASQTDTGLGENTSTPPASTHTTRQPGLTLFPSLTLIPSSTGRQLVAVETSTPPESSINTTSRPGPTIPPSPTPIPSSTGRQMVVVQTSTPPDPFSFSMPSPWIGATTALPDTLTSSTPLDTTPVASATESSMPADIPSSTMLFYSIVTALYPTSTAVPASISIPPPVTSIYSILPVLDSTTISTSSSSSPALTSVHSMLSLSESSTSGLAPESQPSTIVYSILPVSDSIPTTESSTLAYSILPVLDASTPVVPTSTLVYSILPASTTTAIISPTPTTASESLTSNFPLPSVMVAPAKDVYQSTSVPGAPITLAESRSSEAVDSSSSLSSSANEPSSSSQRINNLALQPTADPDINSLPVTVVTSGSITRTFVVRPTVGITGVGGAPGDGEARGLPSSGDTRSHPKALPIILGSVLGCAAMIGLLLFVVCRRRRLRRWHRLPEPSFRDVYEPALDASRHSSRFLNPFSDIDDDWSIIAPGDVERPVSATTTASTLAFAPSQGDGDDLEVSERWETRRTRWLTLSPPARW